MASRKPKFDLGDLGRFANDMLGVPKELAQKVKQATQVPLSAPTNRQGWKAMAPTLNPVSGNLAKRMSATAEAAAKAGVNEYTGVADAWRLIMGEGNTAVNAAWLAANFIPGGTGKAVRGARRNAAMLGRLVNKGEAEGEGVVNLLGYWLANKE